MINYVVSFLLVVMTGCNSVPNSAAYRDFYAHLKNPGLCSGGMSKKQSASDYYLNIYVNARHLDYTDNYSFLNTLARHPSDGSTNRDVGHAWIYLQGIREGKIMSIFGGHSGELGLCQAKYFDGIMNYMDFGYANPPFRAYQYEPNPVKYLWETQKDGYFEWGAGIHESTYAVKVELTEDEFVKIVDFVNNYGFSDYSLTGNQCASFVVQVASLAGLDLESKVVMAINKELRVGGERIRLWEDPCYSQLTFSSPDILERSLMKAVKEGKAEPIFK